MCPAHQPKKNLNSTTEPLTLTGLLLESEMDVAMLAMMFPTASRTGLATDGSKASILTLNHSVTFTWLHNHALVTSSGLADPFAVNLHKFCPNNEHYYRPRHPLPRQRPIVMGKEKIHNPLGAHPLRAVDPESSTSQDIKRLSKYRTLPQFLRRLTWEPCCSALLG